MPLLQFVVILLCVGLVLWGVNQLPMIDAKIKKIINIVVVIAVVLFVLNLFGVLGPFDRIRIGR